MKAINPKRKSLLPNVITAFALSCGVFVILKMNMYEPGQVTYNNVFQAVGILMFAAFLDLLDGAIARAIKAESDFGGIFDSMADAISFGLAPSVVILKTLSVTPKTVLSFFVIMAAMLYSISGVLRLVRFAVTSYRNRGDEEKIAADKAYFTGMPIPAGAAVTTSTTLLLASPEFQSVFPISDAARAIVAIIVFFIVGYFMVSRWKFFSLKSLQIKVSSFQVVVITVFAAAIVLLGSLQYFPVVFAALSWLYFLGAATYAIVRHFSGEKMRVQDEEQEEDETEQ